MKRELEDIRRAVGLKDDALADAVQKGWIKPAASETGIPLQLPIASLNDLLQELQQDRRDR